MTTNHEALRKALELQRNNFEELLGDPSSSSNTRHVAGEAIDEIDAALSQQEEGELPKQRDAHRLMLAAGFSVEYNKETGVHTYAGRIEDAERLLARASMPVKEQEPVFYVNGDELLNVGLSRGGAITLSAERNGWYKTPLYTTPRSAPIELTADFQLETQIAAAPSHPVDTPAGEEGEPPLSMSMCVSSKDYEERKQAVKEAAGQPKLAVWYGAMPETNGKSNFTAILHAGDIADGITLDRSEYPDRVRYEADRARYLIGELKERPFILDYDDEKCSDYEKERISRHPTASNQEDRKAKQRQALANLIEESERLGLYGDNQGASLPTGSQQKEVVAEIILELMGQGRIDWVNKGQSYEGEPEEGFDNDQEERDYLCGLTAPLIRADAAQGHAPKRDWMDLAAAHEGRYRVERNGISWEVKCGTGTRTLYVTKFGRRDADLVAMELTTAFNDGLYLGCTHGSEG